MTDIEELKALLQSNELDEVEEFVSTGSMLLDYAIANKKGGGLPVGRISEIIGENQSGKTLIGTHVLANTQKKDGIAICIDTEHDFDKAFSSRVGVDWSKMIYRGDDIISLEDTFGFIEEVVKTTRLKCPDRLITILWDSIAATPARRELDEETEATKLMGVHAKIMSHGLRKIRGMIKKERILLFCTNQLRHKIGVIFGSPETTPHGKSMAFYASVRIRLAGSKKIPGEQERIIGAICEPKVIKNKVGPGWRDTKFPLMYDYGIDDVQSWLDYLFSQGVVTGKAWKKIVVDGQEHSFRGKDWRKLLGDNPEIYKYVLKKVDELMTVTFDKKYEDFNIDIDSLLEMEQLKADVEGQ